MSAGPLMATYRGFECVDCREAFETLDELAAHLPCDGKRRAGSAAEVIDGALESARGGGQ